MEMKEKGGSVRWKEGKLKLLSHVKWKTGGCEPRGGVHDSTRMLLYGAACLGLCSPADILNTHFIVSQRISQPSLWWLCQWIPPSTTLCLSAAGCLTVQFSKWLSRELYSASAVLNPTNPAGFKETHSDYWHLHKSKALHAHLHYICWVSLSLLRNDGWILASFLCSSIFIRLKYMCSVWF